MAERNGNGNGNGKRYKATPVWDSMDLGRKLAGFQRSWAANVRRADDALSEMIAEMDAAWKQHDPDAKQLAIVESD